MMRLNIRTPSELLKCLGEEGLAGEWVCLTDTEQGNISPYSFRLKCQWPHIFLHILGVRPNLDLRKTILFIVEVIICV